MSKETTKKKEANNAEPQEKNATRVVTFRGDDDKAVGVTIWFKEPANGTPPFLYYNQSRTYLKNSQKEYTKNSFFRGNAKGHAEALLKAEAFMDEHEKNPVAAIDAGRTLEAIRNKRLDDEKAKEQRQEIAA